MADLIIQYVYKSFLDHEIKSEDRRSSRLYCYTSGLDLHLEGIKSIDGFPCDVYVYVSTYNYYIKIKSKKLYDTTYHTQIVNKIYYSKGVLDYTATKDYEKELDEKEKGAGHKNSMKIIKKEDVEKFIYKLIKLLNGLKFDNFKGEFYEEYIPYNIYDVFKSPNVDTENGEECIVCYERTLTKTCCNHSVCYKCMEKLPNKNHPDYSKHIPCPMCRTNILYPKDEDMPHPISDSDEDDVIDN